MFDEKNYSTSQLNAIKYDSSNLLLIAGPGSGKTHTMTGKILYLTEICNINPESILVITFTKDAAVSMQKRYINASDIGAGVAFGTFHSVFYHMICEYKKPSPPELIFDKVKHNIAGSVANKFLQDHDKSELSELTVRITDSISIFKNTLDKDKASDFLPEKYRCEFMNIFSYYESIRLKRNLVDFDDMVYECLKLLETEKNFRSKWSERFKYILIDEFQDINPVQYETVKKLAGNETLVFAVGDDDQSIYGFRGSDPSCIKKYIDEMNAELLYLNENYRSTDIIVSSSLRVINENKNRIKKDLTSKKIGNPNDLIIKCFPDKESEFKEILSKISCLLEPCAILFRTNLDMQYFAAYLSGLKVPYNISEKTNNIYEHFIMTDIFAYFHAIYRNDPGSIKEIINKPARYINTEAIINGGGNIDEMIKYILNNKGIKNQFEKIKKLNELKNDLRYMKNLSPYYALSYLYNKMGYKKYVLSLSRDNGRLHEEYEQTLEKAMEISSISDDLNELLLIRQAYNEDLNKIKKKNTKTMINLMTVHASKGLEFKTVIIPDCNEGIFPHGRMPDTVIVEEERRLFYVGMTRAISKLSLFYVSGNNQRNHPENRIPSRFLNPLLKK